MNQQKADDFISWFLGNDARVAELAREMFGFERGESPHTQRSSGLTGAQLSPAERARQVRQIFDTIQKEVMPRLREVDPGLVFELGPGKTKPYAFILSAGGITEKIPAVRYLSEKLSAHSVMEVIGFKPPRPLGDESRQIVEIGGAQREVRPADVGFSLTPEVTKIGVKLYLPDYREEDRKSWGQVGFNYLDFALGEYEVMESVGSVAFGAFPQTGNESLPVTQLAETFAAAKEKLRSHYGQLKDAAPSDRFAWCIDDCNAALARLRSKFEHASGEHFLNLFLWSESGAVMKELSASLPDFEVQAMPQISAVGKGLRISATGPVSAENFEPVEWLRTRLWSSFEVGAFLIGLNEPVIPPRPFVLVVANGLLQQGRQSEAVKLLRIATAKYRDEDNGTLHSLLALAFRKADRHREAIAAYRIALNLFSDNGLRGEAHTNMGSSFQILGELPQALEQFEKALQLDGGMGSRHYNVGQAYAQMGDAKTACAHLSNALRLSPNLLEQLRGDKDLAALRQTAEYRELVQAYG